MWWALPPAQSARYVMRAGRFFSPGTALKYFCCSLLDIVVSVAIVFCKGTRIGCVLLLWEYAQNMYVIDLQGSIT